MWIFCIVSQWILMVTSVVHCSFVQSPSTVVTVGRSPYLLYMLFLTQCTSCLLQTQKKYVISMTISASRTVLSHLYLWVQTYMLYLAMAHTATASKVRFTTGLVVSTLTRHKGGSIHSSTSWKEVTQ